MCSFSWTFSLDWHHSLHKEYSLEDFEKIRQARRFRNTLKMSASHRHRVLMEEWDATMPEILTAATEVSIARKERLKTIRRDMMEKQRDREILMSTCKSIHDVFNRQRSLSSKWKKNIKALQQISSDKNPKRGNHDDTDDNDESISSLALDTSSSFSSEDSFSEGEIRRSRNILL